MASFLKVHFVETEQSTINKKRFEEVEQTLESVKGSSLQPTAKEIKVLSFCMELFTICGERATPAGAIRLTDHRLKWAVDQSIVTILFQKQMLLLANHNKIKPSYKWNTIKPNLLMIRRLMEDAEALKEMKKDTSPQEGGVNVEELKTFMTEKMVEMESHLKDQIDQAIEEVRLSFQRKFEDEIVAIQILKEELTAIITNPSNTHQDSRLFMELAKLNHRLASLTVN